MPSRFWIWFAPLALAVAVMIVALDNFFPGALAARDSQIRLVYALGLLALVGSSVILGWRHQPAVTLQHAVIWSGIFAALLVVYAYRTELSEVASRLGVEISPSSPVVTAPGEVTIRSSVDGHFTVVGDVNDVPVRFMIDTGASFVSLTMADSQSIGIQSDSLLFNIPVSTANGQTMGAAVTLQEIVIGDIKVNNVGATVMPDGLEQSLLGMSFLRRLTSYEVSQDKLILHQ